MRNQISKWVDQRFHDHTEMSVLQAWVDDSNETRIYFSFYSNNVFQEFEIDPDDKSYYIVSKTESINNFDTLVPNGETSRIHTAQMEINCIGSRDYESTLDCDLRVQRAHTDEMGLLENIGSTLSIVAWIEEGNIPDINESVKNEINAIINDRIGINLERHHDYIGNVIFILGNEMIEFTQDESPHLKIDSDFVSSDDLHFVAEWEEYGDKIWSESVPFTRVIDDDQDTQSGSINLQVDYNGNVYTVDFKNHSNLDKIIAPGATNVRICVVENGDVIDSNHYPLIRLIPTNVQVVSGETEAESGPPALYHGSPTDCPGTQFVTGEHIWDDRRIEFGSRNNHRGWCTGADEMTVSRALGTIHSEMGSTVKISDPYLNPDQIVNIVEELNDDQNAWFITSKAINSSKLDHQLKQWGQKEHRIEILRIIDNDGAAKGSPLHDRFILTDGPHGHVQGWVFGTSFNSLDTNVSVISGLPIRVVNQLDSAFNSWWYEPVDDRRNSGNCNKTFKKSSEYSQYSPTSLPDWWPN